MIAMNDVTVRAAFEVSGFAEDPALVSQALGVQPSEIHRAGEHRVGADRSRLYVVKDNYWGISLERTDVHFLDEVIVELLTKLSGVRENISKLPAAATKRIVVQVSMSEAASVPSLTLDRSLLRQLSDLSVDLVVDIN